MKINKKTKRKGFIGLLLAVLILSGAYFIFINRDNNPSSINNNETPKIISAKFFCKDNRFIYTIFNNEGEGSVEISLSDGRKIILPRAISASGARYANADETLVFWNKGNTAFIEENSQMTFVDCVIMDSGQTTGDNTGIANPASANCIKQKGTLKIRDNKMGQYGVCLFEDNRQCEEWALLRGQCPVGGLKITGYDNEAQIYCAITGGNVEGVGTDSVMCKRTDGTYCQVEANFNGDCPDPNDPNPNSGNVEAD